MVEGTNRRAAEATIEEDPRQAGSAPAGAPAGHGRAPSSSEPVIRRGSGNRGGPLVEVSDLRKVYEPSPRWMRFLLKSAIDAAVVALDKLSFTVAPGQICAIVGPNGAGKSTLFRVLTGLTTPTSGSAKVMGLDAHKDSAAVRRKVGFVPADDRSLYLRHTARENLIFHGNLQGLPSKQIRRRADDALELVGLGKAATRVGFALSAGMRARLQLARALLHEPSVLILDEPTGSVDPVGSYQLLKTLELVTEERAIAVLISSHRLEEIEALHDHVLLLDRGMLVYQGDLDSLRRLWDTPQLRIRFTGREAADAAAELLGGEKGVEVVDVEPPEVTVRTTTSTGSLLMLLGGRLAEIESIEERRISLLDLLSRVALEQSPSPNGRNPAP